MTDMDAARGGRTARTAGPAGFASLAPSVEADWLEDFVLERRILGVPGPRIGDALAVVESPVVESGESAREAFGDPRDDARRSAPSRRVPDDRAPGWILGLAFGLVGMVLTSIGADEW